MFQGTYTALITPLHHDGSVDHTKLAQLVEEQISAGITGLVPMGSTGESPTFNHDEHIEVIKEVVKLVNGRVPVIAGTGSNSTREAIDLTKRALDCGADASLQVAPYYNKPSQEGFYAHFLTIAEQVDLPMVVYNIPGRSGKNIEASTILKLAEHPRIHAVKEASGNFSQFMEILSKRPQGFKVLSGDDNLTYPLMSLGADGVISVVSQLIPEEYGKMVELCLNNKFTEARAIHYQYLSLFSALTLDTNPVPIKSALALQGRCQGNFRMPLVPLTEELKDRLSKVLGDYNLI